MTWFQLKPRISIIIPCYDAAAYIQSRAWEIINSPLHIHNAIEVVFVSDGADAATVEGIKVADGMLREAGIPSRPVFMPDNAGTLKAEYDGLQRATGKWVYFHDADDPFNGGLVHELAETHNAYERMNIHLAAPTRLVVGGKLTNTIWHSITGPADDVLRCQHLDRHGCISRRGLFYREHMLPEYDMLISTLDAAGIGPINAVQDSVVITWLLGRGYFREVRETRTPYLYTYDNPASMSRDPERRKRDIAVLMAVTEWASNNIALSGGESLRCHLYPLGGRS